MLINILFIIALTFPVAISSTAFSVSGGNKKWGRNLMFAIILALGQGVMYTLGSLLGGTFMHLLEPLSKWIVLALCFSISYRMVMNTLKIKNGDNLYFIEKKIHLFLLSIALGINSFIAGLMEDFLPLLQNLTPYILVAVAFVWSVIAMLIPFSKLKLTFNSMLNMVFAAIIFVRGLLFII